jgi:hypothetical protein
VLSLKSNNLNADGGKALAEGLKGNTVITELDISGNALGVNSNFDQDMSGVIALADAIPNMGALSKFTFSGGVPEYDDGSGWTDGDPVTLEAGMTEANFSNRELGVPGAMIISAWLSSGKDKRAMTSLNLASNNICLWGNMDGTKAISSAIQVLAIILVPF